MQYAIQSANFVARYTGIVVDALTSRKAIRFYARVWHYTLIGIQAIAALTLLLGALLFTLGWFTRQGVRQHNQAVNRFVQSHEVPTVEVVPALPPAKTLEVLLPEGEADPWEAPVEPLRVLITPPVLVDAPVLMLAPAKEEVKPVKAPRKTAKKGRGKKVA